MQNVTTGSTRQSSVGMGFLGTVPRIRMQEQVSAQCTNQEHSSTLLAKRYELKYRISEVTALAIQSFIRSYLDVDKYARIHPSGQYPICSLYLDSPRFDLFQETITDKCNRFKLRIRGYDDEPNSALFFEIKRKLNRIIYKSRAKVDKNQLMSILNGHYVPRDLPEKDRITLQQFIHYCQCLQARPMVLVRYMREAYENSTASKVRITFDRQLCYQYVNGPIFKLNGPGWSTLPIDFVVMEIKFTSNYPSWLIHMARLFNLNRQSMSKYCSAIRPLVPRGSDFYSMPKR